MISRRESKERRKYNVVIWFLKVTKTGDRQNQIFT